MKISAKNVLCAPLGSVPVSHGGINNKGNPLSLEKTCIGPTLTLFSLRQKLGAEFDNIAQKARIM